MLIVRNEVCQSNGLVKNLSLEDFTDFLKTYQIDKQSLKEADLRRFLAIVLPPLFVAGVAIGNVGMEVAKNVPTWENVNLTAKSGIENIKNSLFENEMKSLIQKHLSKINPNESQIKQNTTQENERNVSTFEINSFNGGKKIIATVNFSKNSITDQNFVKLGKNAEGGKPAEPGILDQNMVNLIPSENFLLTMEQNDPRTRSLASEIVKKIIQERALEGKPVSVKINKITGNSAQIIIQDIVSETKEKAQIGVST